MCKCLKISRQTYYNSIKKTSTSIHIDPLNDIVVELFIKNQRVYGTRKLKVELEKLGYVVSRRRISRIMRKNNLVSAYTAKKYRPHKTKTNESDVPNIVNREFSNRHINEVFVSDLTYVRIRDRWGYLCTLIDLYNREIVGSSCGMHKNAVLVEEAFLSTGRDLNKIEYFHTDRGSEFDNYLIDEVLEKHHIKRSLSNKGNPYDNAVAEAGFKIIKTEFVKPRCFESLEQLKMEWAAYMYWYNNIRIHSTLGYKAPVEYRNSSS